MQASAGRVGGVVRPGLVAVVVFWLLAGAWGQAAPKRRGVVARDVERLDQSGARRPGAVRRSPMREDPRARQQWFMRGRTPQQGTPGEALLRAYQQKLQGRALRLKQSVTESATSFAPPTWTHLGPAPIISDSFGRDPNDYWGLVTGRVSAIAIDPTDQTGNTIYVAAASGGVWKSTNAAAGIAANVSWTPLTEDQATLSFGAVAVKPDNGNIVLAGSGEPNSGAATYYGLGIMRSIDGGTTWTLITSADGGLHPFRGYGISQFAFSNDNPSLVVAGVNGLTNGIGNGAIQDANVRGLYYSTNAGATWQAASVHDGAITTDPASISSVVFNKADHAFYAALRFHGVYSSSDGQNWTRLTNQPGSQLSTASCPGAPVSQNCPLGFAKLAVPPGRNEIYIWYANDANAPVNQGVYVSKDSGASWTKIDTASMDDCEPDNNDDGCGTEQGYFNLVLTAVPTATGTDVYAGAVNLFKCSMATNSTTCNGGWLNLSHVYGCLSSPTLPTILHPDQHAIEFVPVASGSPAIIYFGNDGGVYRTANASGLNNGSCSANQPIVSLNGTLGSFAQFYAFAGHPTDSRTFVGGTQDNGSPAVDLAHSGANGLTWTEVQSGDGAWSAINPQNPGEWFVEYVNTQIYRCPSGGINCTETDFDRIIAPSQTLDGDLGAFFTPFILDPGNTSQIIVGVCRVWRGPSTGAGWTFNNNAISNNFDTNGIEKCLGDEDHLVRSLAAGGPTSSAGSQVIYAGTEFGKVFVTTNASGGPSTWADRTTGLNSGTYEISGIALDPSDSTGRTAYVTVMGFGVPHVWKTANAGVNWTNIDGGRLPDAPANAVAIDPVSPSTVYVGTDVGVYVTQDGGASWLEYGNLPNVPVMDLKTFASGTTRKLTAATFGRGVWQTNLASASAQQGTLTFSPTYLTFENQLVNTLSATKTITVTATGASVVISTVSSGSSQFTIPSNTCAGVTLAAGQTCAIGVRFAPTSIANPISGTISVASNGAGSPQAIAVSGNAISSTSGAVRPENGLWWDPKLNGIGFGIEHNPTSNNGAGGMFVTAFLFDNSGNPTWQVSTGPMNGSTYTGDMLLMRNGQQLNGPWFQPVQVGTAGSISITFTDPTHATMRRPDGTSINIERFFFYGSGDTPVPQPGTAEMPLWWRGQAFTGTGYALEFQGSSFAAVAYVFDAAGNPIWYLTIGGMTNPTTYTNTWKQYRNGPTLLSAECPPGGGTTPACTGAQEANPNVSPVTFQFSSPVLGTMTLGSTVIPIERFRAF